MLNPIYKIDKKKEVKSNVLVGGTVDDSISVISSGGELWLLLDDGW